MRLLHAFLVLIFSLGLLTAQTVPTTNAPATNAPPRALPVNPAELQATAPAAVAGGVNVHWYGHGFVYLTSSVGIRCALDPYGAETVHYTFPPHLAADFVLITHEAEDHGAADQIFGNPLIFRSVMAVGLNRANGIPFYGVGLAKDNTGHGVSNTAFSLKFDGLRFCYLGQISAPLLAAEREQLGKCDVLFLPVGLETLSVADFNQLVRDLGPKIIIPINYKTEHSGILQLRGLDDYLAGAAFPVRKLSTDELIVTRDSLPDKPTIYVLKSP